MSLRRKAPLDPAKRRVFDVQFADSAVLSVLRRYRITDAVRETSLETEWEDLVGTKMAKHARPDGIRGRVLQIDVSSAVWMQELSLLKPKLLAKLLERIGRPRLFEDLRFNLVGRSRREPVVLRAKRPPPPPPKPMPPPASGEARDRIEQEVSVVDDPDLRALIASVRITHDR